MSTCLVVQHVGPEGPHAIGEALARAGVAIDLRRIFAGQPLPSDLDGFDAVVVMGGPMSAVHDRGFPTRAAEVAILAEALTRHLPVLAVCLGAQLLVAAAGGKVYAGTVGAEIGWAPVTLTEQAGVDPLFSGLAPELTVLHWHGDTFDLPPRAVRLASSIHYPNQAFRLGTAAWGLQFHLEVDAVAVEAFLHSFGDDAVTAGVAPEEIAAATPGALDRLSAMQTSVLARFATLVAERRPTTAESCP